METLLSNIQNSFNQTPNQTLLQRQQTSQQNINELLESSVQSIMCGPTCQNERKSNELRQKYLDAETNKQTASSQFEQSRKNYFVFSEGETYYNNMKEKELEDKANKLAESIKNNFNNEISDAFTMNLYLNTAIINSEHTKELLKQYIEKNELLKTKLGERRGDILTNDRKTYYETEALNYLKLWYKFMFIVFYIMFAMLVLSFIFSSHSVSLVKSIVVSILFVFYPYYISILTNKIYNIFKFIFDKLPKNVYNNL
jgi:hypothetical protein